MNPVKAFLDYHHRTSRGPQGYRVTQSLAKHLGRVESLLDIGCGDGANTKRLGEAVGASRVAGVDVHVRATTLIPVTRYDGRSIPFQDVSFEAVSLVDVLHHCEDPQRVLSEAVRVARTVVVIKDHLAFGPVTRKMLYWMDVVGNAKDHIPSPGTYFALHEWVRMIERAGGRLAALDWPLKTHDLPWRLIGWPELQFTAKVLPVRA
jgi:ubiquinone/menaquinone biosynthesis C-methylase UbiE